MHHVYKIEALGFNISFKQVDTITHEPKYLSSESLTLKIYIMSCNGCLNIHRTHVTANNSTSNNVVFFFVTDLKIVYTITTINPWSQKHYCYI